MEGPSNGTRPLTPGAEATARRSPPASQQALSAAEVREMFSLAVYALKSPVVGR